MSFGDDFFDDFDDWQDIGMAFALGDEISEEEKERMILGKEMETAPLDEVEDDCIPPPKTINISITFYREPFDPKFFCQSSFRCSG